jgi:hypothetical protein
MTYITILLAVLAMIIIPIASATLARLIHFALGLQGQDFNIQAVFGKIGLWFLIEAEGNKPLNLFKEAVTCIYCFTTHIATVETIVAYTLLFGPWGLLAVMLVPPIALTLQNYLQFYIYQPYFTPEGEEAGDIPTEEQHNGSN